jgi:hypothetical protein
MNTAAKITRPCYLILPLKRAQTADWRGWHVVDYFSLRSYILDHAEQPEGAQ